MLFFATTVAAVTVGETATAAAPTRGQSNVAREARARAGNHDVGRSSAAHQGRKKGDRARPSSAEGPAPQAPPPRRRIVVFPFHGDDGTLSAHVGRLLAESGFVVLDDVKPIEKTEK